MSEQNNEPISNKLDIAFTPNVPAAKLISGYGLLDMGFIKHSESVLPFTQTKETVYKKEDCLIAYNGYKWMMIKESNLKDRKEVQFMEDIII